MYDLLPRYIHTEPTMTLAPTLLPSEYEGNQGKAENIYRALIRRWLRTVASERQNHICCYCGRETNDIPEDNLQATLDHVIPRSLGGQDTLDNTVMACAKCNRSRSSQDVERYWIKRQKDFAGNNRRGNRVAGPSFEVCSYAA